MVTNTSLLLGVLMLVLLALMIGFAIGMAVGLLAGGRRSEAQEPAAVRDPTAPAPYAATEPAAVPDRAQEPLPPSVLPSVGVAQRRGVATSVSIVIALAVIAGCCLCVFLVAVLMRTAPPS